MTKDIVPAAAEGMPKFNRSEILTKAWADYRRDERMGWGPKRGGPFDRKRFAYCLRMAWAVAKEVAARAAAPAPPASIAKTCTDPVRAAEIRAELRDMEYGDFIPWARHTALSVELALLSA